ncbi:MAG: tRNA lysidine(34) synthetase TilS [Gemmatimonadaceae bacterium]
MSARALLTDTESRRIETAVRRCATGRRLVLAVSGGRDSMTLLHAVARVNPRAVAMVATFDHGTGRAATRASAVVAREAARLGFPVVIGRAADAGRSEASWREARQAFLRDVARAVDGVVTTAHTRDDQVETVLMRVLRRAGARGLAGLYARSDTLRPLLDLSRESVAAYARAIGVAWVEDPTNVSVAFLRNRVRRDVLPALAARRPTLESELLDIARRAARVRASLDAHARAIGETGVDARTLSVAASDLAGYSRDELAVLWPALAARLGVVMDWRGTERAAAFTTRSRAGARVPLSGGWEIARSHDRFEVRRAAKSESSVPMPLAPGTRWERWRFDTTPRGDDASGAWVAQLPAHAALSVREWRPGDRMRLGDGVTRRVKRFLSDARVSGSRRTRWPVVLADDVIVWIPGVRRSDAAAVRPGRPGALYRCEFDHR